VAATPIHNVVFDIGWVLVELDYLPLIELLRSHGAADVTDRDSVMSRIALEEHECGRLSGAGLLQRIAALAGTAPAPEAVRACWMNMFAAVPQMLDLAHRLSERYRVFLLSNVGDLHWMQLSREFRMHAVGHGALPSYLAGVMKPHPHIYAAAERRFALEPAATVFVDDRADNIAAAQARGWQGIVHRNPAATRAALAALGVAAPGSLPTCS
jgi:FMN phosphatase YigB (HAD superfamily)